MLEAVTSLPLKDPTLLKSQCYQQMYLPTKS
jgi:hypothetical protein